MLQTHGSLFHRSSTQFIKPLSSLLQLNFPLHFPLPRLSCNKKFCHVMNFHFTLLFKNAFLPVKNLFLLIILPAHYPLANISFHNKILLRALSRENAWILYGVKYLTHTTIFTMKTFSHLYFISQHIRHPHIKWILNSL